MSTRHVHRVETQDAPIVLTFEVAPIGTLSFVVQKSATCPAHISTTPARERHSEKLSESIEQISVALNEDATSMVGPSSLVFDENPGPSARQCNQCNNAQMNLFLSRSASELGSIACATSCMLR